MNRPSLWKTIVLICASCAVAAVASPVQGFKSVVSFDVTDGVRPYYGSLVQGNDGSLYGTTVGGGANGLGTVFKLAAGNLITPHRFDGTHGASPTAGLVKGVTGAFYGTTLGGEAYSSGTVFKITPAGQLTTLYSFCAQAGCMTGPILMRD